MKEEAKQLLKVMAKNRKRHDGARYWGKLRVDRICKLVSKDVDVDELVAYMVENDLVKETKKKDDSGKLVPAIRLKYEQYKSFTREGLHASNG